MPKISALKSGARTLGKYASKQIRGVVGGVKKDPRGTAQKTLKFGGKALGFGLKHKKDIGAVAGGAAAILGSDLATAGTAAIPQIIGGGIAIGGVVHRHHLIKRGNQAVTSYATKALMNERNINPHYVAATPTGAKI